MVGPFLVVQISSIALFAEVPSRELPMPATVRDLVSEPTRFDGHRVLVTGVIRSIEVERGRRGSEYFVLVLEEQVAAPGESSASVTVIIDTIPGIRKGQRAMIQGVFHREGNQRGRPYEYFIEAEPILRKDAA